MTFLPTDGCNRSPLNDPIIQSRLPPYRHDLGEHLLPLFRPANLSSERFSFSSHRSCRTCRPRTERLLTYPQFSSLSPPVPRQAETDRKSTRLNSTHVSEYRMPAS